jgi:hypothetical protein
MPPGHATFNLAIFRGLHHEKPPSTAVELIIIIVGSATIIIRTRALCHFLNIFFFAGGGEKYSVLLRPNKYRFVNNVSFNYEIIHS